jgi:hypothetical protein
MKIMAIIGEIGQPTTGVSVPGFVGASVWRARPFHGAKSVLSGLTAADVPANKPPRESASERCP